KKNMLLHDFFSKNIGLSKKEGFCNRGPSFFVPKKESGSFYFFTFSLRSCLGARNLLLCKRKNHPGRWFFEG
ncbi:hypothetical protein ACOIIK_004211, partial [Cronobacter sakazakii]